MNVKSSSSFTVHAVHYRGKEGPELSYRSFKAHALIFRSKALRNQICLQVTKQFVFVKYIFMHCAQRKLAERPVFPRSPPSALEPQ